MEIARKDDTFIEITCCDDEFAVMNAGLSSVLQMAKAAYANGSRFVDDKVHEHFVTMLEKMTAAFSIMEETVNLEHCMNCEVYRDGGHPKCKGEQHPC